MNKMLVIILFLGLGFASCTEKQQVMTQKDVQKEVDSLFKLKMEIINKQASEDLDYRSTIEVKAKVDSIVAAKNMPKDSLKARMQATAPSSRAVIEERRRKMDSVMRIHRLPH